MKRRVRPTATWAEARAACLAQRQAERAARQERWHRRVRRRFRHSLRWRLVGLFVVMAVATAVIFLVGTQRLMAEGFNGLVRPVLADYLDRLAADIGSPPEVAKARALTARLPISVRIEGPVVHWQSSSAALGERPEAGADWRRRWDAKERPAWLTRTTADGHRIEFGVDEGLWLQQRHWRGWVPLVGLMLLTWLAYVAVRRVFSPLDDIRAGTLRYSEGDFSQPIPVRARRHDELSDLAQEVNAMADALKDRLEQQRALLLAISHELRSPLTRARLHAELLDEGAEREALLRDLGLMRELISDLLESERLATGTADLRCEPTDLNALVAELVETQFSTQPIQLALADAVPVMNLDRSRVQMLVRNLIDNACRHGAAAGAPVTVGTQLDGEHVVLWVRDEGPGVAPEHLARLTEPFYRPDTARTRAAGGVGLGLYLCQLVARSHQATLTLENANPGLRVEVRWAR